MKHLEAGNLAHTRNCALLQLIWASQISSTSSWIWPIMQMLSIHLAVLHLGKLPWHAIFIGNHQFQSQSRSKNIMKDQYQKANENLHNYMLIISIILPWVWHMHFRIRGPVSKLWKRERLLILRIEKATIRGLCQDRTQFWTFRAIPRTSQSCIYLSIKVTVILYFRIKAHQKSTSIPLVWQYHSSQGLFLFWAFADDVFLKACYHLPCMTDIS